MWHLYYETAVIGTYETELEVWIAHDEAVIRGLNHDKLAYGKVPTISGGY